jgi:predicted nucleotidyltransferase
MKVLTFNKVITRLDEQILRTLLYFDIFNYPLRSEEVLKFLGIPALDKSIVTSRLNILHDQNIIFRFDEFFSMKNDGSYVERLISGNKEAEKYFVVAERTASFISKFPFVRSVMASGSLSKGYMDKDSDLDFFIVTAPKRLWIARTLLVLYKRIFLANSHKYFCVNYFVDEEHLEIEEKNLFTATELATVIPLYGSQQYGKLQAVNSWLNEFFPNYKPRSVAGVPALKVSWIKKNFENLLSIFFGDTLEKYLQRKTLSRWKKLYQKNYTASDFKVAFKSKSYASKNHPRNFQRTIIDVYDEKLRSFGLQARPNTGAAVIQFHSESTVKSNASV